MSYVITSYIKMSYVICHNVVCHNIIITSFSSSMSLALSTSLSSSTMITIIMTTIMMLTTTMITTIMIMKIQALTSSTRLVQGSGVLFFARDRVKKYPLMMSAELTQKYNFSENHSSSGLNLVPAARSVCCRQVINPYLPHWVEHDLIIWLCYNSKILQRKWLPCGGISTKLNSLANNSRKA